MTLFEHLFDTRLMGEDLREYWPYVPVLINVDGRWYPGELSAWSLEPDGWYGRARLSRTGAVNWWPAIALRKVESA